MKTLRALFRFVAVLIVLLVGCAKDPVSPESLLDKEVRLQITNNSLGGSNEWVGGSIYDSRLLGFDIRNYPDVDSVVFMCRVVSYGAEAAIRLRLFNVTDNVPIEESEISAAAFDSKTLYSVNLRRVLPNHPVDLSMQIKDEGATGSGTGPEGAFLILYRK